MLPLRVRLRSDIFFLIAKLQILSRNGFQVQPISVDFVLKAKRTFFGRGVNLFYFINYAILNFNNGSLRDMKTLSLHIIMLIVHLSYQTSRGVCLKQEKIIIVFFFIDKFKTSEDVTNI